MQSEDVLSNSPQDGRYPAHYTWRDRLGVWRAKAKVDASLARQEWVADDSAPHEPMLTRPVAPIRPLDWRTEQRMLRRPNPW